MKRGIMRQFTLRNLKKNKVRTIVTILGVILSTAMFAAVTEGMVSGKAFMVDFVTAEDGGWMIRGYDLDKQQAEELLAAEDAEKMAVRTLCYTKTDGENRNYCPYLAIKTLEEDYASFLPEFEVTEGRVPKKEDEIMVPERALKAGVISFRVKDRVTFSAAADTESLENGKTEEAVYTVVGSYKGKSSFSKDESVNAYMAYTMMPKGAAKAIGQTEEKTDVYLILRDAQNAQSVYEKLLKKVGENVLFHDGLLFYMGELSGRRLGSVMNRIETALILIIAVASISLIYNSFAISMSERTKLYGLLKSVGATRKQIKNSVVFEAFVLCAIGIPIGIGVGLGGVAVLLRVMGEILLPVLNEGGYGSAELQLVFSAQAAAAAVVIAVVTVFVSAIIPAGRAVRMPAIEALRQSRDVRVKPKKIRRFAGEMLSYRLFGFSGMMAQKNMKRNKKKQRTIVASLALSVILFLVVSNFTVYMKKSIDLVEDDNVNDVTAELRIESKDSMTRERMDQIIGLAKPYITDVETAKESTYAIAVPALFMCKTDDLGENSYDPVQIIREGSIGKNALIDSAVIYFVEDKVYEKFLKENHLDTAAYMDTKNPILLYNDSDKHWEEGKRKESHILREGSLSGTLYALFEEEDSVDAEYSLDTDGSICVRRQEYEEEEVRETVISMDEAGVKLPCEKAQIIKDAVPVGSMGNSDGAWVRFYLPYRAIRLLPENFRMQKTVQFGIRAKDHAAAAAEISEKSDGISAELKRNQAGEEIYLYCTDQRAGREAMNALVLLLRVFSYTFIGFISLIIAVNVFHTIATNISLRRQEFAMLRSVGVSQKQLYRLMNTECLFYGLKGLGFGLPVSAVISYVLYETIQETFSYPFFFPIGGVVVVCVCVFAIVFASMVYSMQKIKKENPMETLRNEVI